MRHMFDEVVACVAQDSRFAYFLGYLRHIRGQLLKQLSCFETDLMRAPVKWTVDSLLYEYAHRLP